MRKVILYIAMSVDGYICDKNNSLDFLSIVEDGNEDYGYSEFNKSVDTVIVGKNTYNKVISMGFEYPHKDKDVYIISHDKIENLTHFKTYSGNLKILITHLKEKKGKNIYCDGGANIVTQLLENNLIDIFIISIIPVLLGGGIKLFQGDYLFSELTHIKTNTFQKGLVQLHYEKTK